MVVRALLPQLRGMMVVLFPLLALCWGWSLDICAEILAVALTWAAFNDGGGSLAVLTVFLSFANHMPFMNGHR